VDKIQKIIMLGGYAEFFLLERDTMETITIIRIVAGVVALVILVVLISRLRARKQ
jgi:hypothetical protein